MPPVVNLQNYYIPSFYEAADYVSDSNRIVRRTLNREYVHISERSKPGFDQVFDYFNRITQERVGVLHGEYILSGGLLIRRNGTFLKAGIAWEEPVACKVMSEGCASEDFKSVKQLAINAWDQWPFVDSPPVISHPWSRNYFHWTCETMPRIRFIKEHLVKSPPLFLKEYLVRAFQTNLLSRVVKDKVLISDRLVRVKNPMLFYECMTDEGIHWLRERVNLPAPSGNRKIYLRRVAKLLTRNTESGGISETEAFLEFLKEFNFEIVDLGMGQLGIEEQIALLSNASVILAPHGASLTNIVYMNPPLSVIEIMAPRTTGAMYAHIASMIGLQYYGVFSEDYDDEGNIIVDMDELRDIMKDCLS